MNVAAVRSVLEIRNKTVFYHFSDLHTRLKNARSSDGTTDSIGDIMLNWVGIFM